MKFINLHSHISSGNPNHLEIINQYPAEINSNIPTYSTGIHPWYINKETIETDLKIINSNLQLTNCVALGECGIDKKIKTDLNLQLEIFEKQILLAVKYNKPIIIHCVAAFQEIIAVKLKLSIEIPLVIHGFSKNVEVANQLIKNDFYLSFGKNLLLNPDSKGVLREIPIDKIFLETDNSQYKIEEIYAKAADYLEIEIIDLKNQIHSNYNKVFNQKQ